MLPQFETFSLGAMPAMGLKGSDTSVRQRRVAAAIERAVFAAFYRENVSPVIRELGIEIHSVSTHGISE